MGRTLCTQCYTSAGMYLRMPGLMCSSLLFRLQGGSKHRTLVVCMLPWSIALQSSALGPKLCSQHCKLAGMPTLMPGLMCSLLCFHLWGWQLHYMALDCIWLLSL
jgi:hypothetical protein